MPPAEVKDVFVHIEGAEALGPFRLAEPIVVAAPAAHVTRAGSKLTISMRTRHRLEDDGVPDHPIGQLPIAGRDPSTGVEKLLLVTIPAPAPFTQGAVEDMWTAVRALPGTIAESVQLQGQHLHGHTLGHRSARNPDALPAALSSARRLLAHWPIAETSEQIWRPIGTSGGRELAGISSRSKAGVPGGTGRSARRVAAGEPWVAGSVSWAARLLLRSLSADESPHPTSARALSAIASRAATPRTVDPPLSSWPEQARSFYEAALRALEEREAGRHGNRFVPLCHLWRLYERWAELQVFDAVVDALGRPPDVPPHSLGAGWAADWDDGLIAVRVRTQPAISQQTVELIPGRAETAVRSVTATLIPDILLCASTRDSTIVWGFDAKQRGARAMDQASGAEAGAKYHWGLRKHDCTPALAGFTILTTTGLEDMFDAETAKISGRRLVPGSDAVELPSSLVAFLGSTQGVRSRV